MQQINIVYILNDVKKYKDLTLYSMNTIKKFFRSKNHTLNFTVVSNVPLYLPPDVANTVIAFDDINMFLTRFDLPDILGVDRFIYIDSDTQAFTCISKLWDTDMGNCIIGAVQSAEFTNVNTLSDMIIKYGIGDAVKSYDIDISKPFYNNGLLIVDVKNWNSFGTTQKLKTLIATVTVEGTHKFHSDEIYTNIILCDHIFALDKRWNYRPHGTVTGYVRPYIVHYYGLSMYLGLS